MTRYLLIMLILATTSVHADTPPIMLAEDAIAQHRLFYYPRPEYPYEARRRSITGSGVFDLRFDYDTGHLREVHVASGTGSPLLDSAAIGALKRWQAKPRMVRKIRVPVTFTKG